MMIFLANSGSPPFGRLGEAPPLGWGEGIKYSFTKAFRKLPLFQIIISLDVNTHCISTVYKSLAINRLTI